MLSSSPIYPPPTSNIDLGIELISRAVVESSTASESGAKGRAIGRDPVASIALSKVTFLIGQIFNGLPKVVDYLVSMRVQVVIMAVKKRGIGLPHLLVQWLL